MANHLVGIVLLYLSIKLDQVWQTVAHCSNLTRGLFSYGLSALKDIATENRCVL